MSNDDEYVSDKAPEIIERGFAPSEMVTCEECLRANPPTRTTCLYCAAALPETERSALLRRPTLRRLEKWERGFNVVLLPDEALDSLETVWTEISNLLRLQEDELKSIVTAREPLPVARASTPEEAALVEERLKSSGLKLVIVPDEELAVEEVLPKRLRALRFDEDSLVAYPTSGAESSSMKWDEIALLVTGRLFNRRVEVEERRGRTTENEIRDAREFMSDEAVLDVYTKSSMASLRITANNFDFSCLGAEKSLIAAENFACLVGELTMRATQSRLDETYNRVRHALAPVWPLDQRTESLGLKREIGRLSTRLSTEEATTISNEAQFTRYSRLRRYLLAHNS
ncbi:MAG TPA: hypothetical protein VK619_02815 [Pyrinomonadaceae bacterium]|nr:hypothetical protein [Pyrinomonadaceae bacterium]